MLKNIFTNFAILATIHASVTGCATHFNVSDPSEGIAVPAVLKSIKCEMITFIEVNRRQREIFGERFKAGYPDAYNYKYLDIADDLFAGVSVELKEVDSKSLTVGFNRISRLLNDKSITYLAGPSIENTNTFEMTQRFALLQSAKLYSQSLRIPPIRAHGPAAPDFDCYNDLPPTKDINLEEVSANYYAPNFRRIKVGDGLYLSQWLQNITSSMSNNYLTSVESREILAPGQIKYSFILDYKLGVDGKYTLVAQIWNPLSVDPSASTQRSSTFSFVFNTNYAPITALVESGGAGEAPCFATSKLSDPDCKLAANHGQSYLRSVGRARLNGTTVSPSSDNRTAADRRSNPNVFYTLPLGVSPIPPLR